MDVGSKDFRGGTVFGGKGVSVRCEGGGLGGPFCGIGEDGVEGAEGVWELRVRGLSVDELRDLMG